MVKVPPPGAFRNAVIEPSPVGKRKAGIDLDED
jgi:hypothetical protein